MSNLGDYQKMTTFAKKLGGPKKLGLILMFGGYAVFRSFEAGAKRGFKKAQKRYIKNSSEEMVFEVTSMGKDKSGLELNTGDKYRVLDSDGEAILIEKLGDSNNPYFVSADFLSTISDFMK